MPGLGLCPQQYYRWLRAPFTEAELDEAWLANATFGAHADDPEFRYRFLADEVRHQGWDVSDQTVWRICSENGWWASFAKPRRNRKATAPAAAAHDDLVQRDFTADNPNQVWVTDITEILATGHHPAMNPTRIVQFLYHPLSMLTDRPEIPRTTIQD